MMTAFQLRLHPSFDVVLEGETLTLEIRDASALRISLQQESLGTFCLMGKYSTIKKLEVTLIHSICILVTLRRDQAW
ncbi:MAG: hypothetical protein A2Z14_15820 [Chloroflexi bacterium RBG_16_48_8]|nr:MAG: hypothetical protein A2Z14_15820 [Chloroflexi bacterium RBG_16_48_8]